MKPNGSDYGYLIPRVMGFYNKEQAQEPNLYHDIRDTAISCFV